MDSPTTTGEPATAFEDDGSLESSSQKFVAPLFIIAVLMLCTTALVLNTYSRQTEFNAQRELILKNSINGVGREISLQLNELRRSVKLLGEREKKMLAYLAKNGDDQFVYEDLVERTREVFPLAMGITVANSEGITLIHDFGQQPVGRMCKADIQYFVQHNKPPGIYIHPSISGHHIDIMAPIDVGLGASTVFFVSFRPDTIIELLANSQLYKHHLLVLFQKEPGQIELTAKGTREQLPEHEHYIPIEQLPNLSHRQAVPGTFWDIAYEINNTSQQKELITMWAETGIEILMLLLLGLLTMFYVVRSDRKMLHKNAMLAQQARNLKKARLAAETANHSKSAFLANMSHELRTPLNAIIGYGEMLQEEARDNGHEHYLSDLERINVSGKHLLTLISDVLDLSKIEAGKLDINYQTFDLSSLIEEIAQSLRSLVKANNNSFVIECDSEIDDVTMDRMRVRQILINMLGNAAKFTHDGTISLIIKQKLIGQQNHIVIDVVDTGMGIEKDRLDDLFAEFTQAGHESDKKKGTGLGLAICRKLSEMMGGTISVRSELNKGSCFTTMIPASPVIAQTGDADAGNTNTTDSSTNNTNDTSSNNSSATNVA